MDLEFIIIDGFLPEDVVKNSGIAVQLIGKLSGEPNEIVVITQLGRSVGTAYVCHLSNGYDKRNIGNPCKCILDVPGFPKIKITQDFLIKERNGVKYTMACMAEKDFDSSRANWLY